MKNTSILFLFLTLLSIKNYGQGCFPVELGSIRRPILIILPSFIPHVPGLKGLS